jgi:glycogen debranching enzyme
LRLAVTATTDGEAVAAGSWRSLGDAPLADTLARLAARDSARRSSTTVVQSPEPQFDDAWEWAKARLASFMLHVPGVGTGLAAGYAASKPGWGDSRPGYGWFFGRDACWSAEAMLGAGMFREARSALEFLAQTADVTGKVAHEVTTSGVAHYDAADSTPLWLRSMALYADWTGDLATVRAHWDQVRAAFAFVLGTDRDGDGLPENTGVGHGWVESGPLGGGAVTSYVASLWIDATRRLARLAERVGDGDLAARAAEACERAAAALAERLRDPVTGRLALQLDADGRATRDRTALDAVPILLEVDTHPSADAAVAELASEDWCAPWGVRMLSRRDARYRAAGYHCGAVWPLFTGWTSLAAYRRGEAAVGWRLLSMVGALAGARARGAFDEVLDGESGGSAGICPDQAWSAAMVITPMISGMLGVRPDAVARRCALAPAWPPTWECARVTGVRVGASRFAVAMSRPDGWSPQGAGGEILQLVLESGPPLTVTVDGADGPPVELVAGVPRTIVRAGERGGHHGRR